MYRNIEITSGIHYVGVNDRRKQLFENMWPLPNGVAYNSYVIVDQKTALLDTVEGTTDGAYIDHIERILGDKELDYLVVNHMEPDHSGMMCEVIRRWPNVQIVGNARTFSIMDNYTGEGCGNRLVVKDGDELSLGEKSLKFTLIPWVHWPETMVTYETTNKILFSADAFGTYGTLDGGIFDDESDFETKYRAEMRRYYSNIVGKYSNMVQKALAKLSSVEISMIAPLHGPIWRSNPAKVIELYDRWSKYETKKGVTVIYASMYGNTALVADYIARKLVEYGVEDVSVFDVSKTHISYLISEIWRVKGVILTSVSYNTDMHPMMKQLTFEIEHIGIKNHEWGLCGTYSWNGGGLRSLEEFAQRAKIETVGCEHQMAGSPTQEKLAMFDPLAKAMAEKING